MGSGNAAPGLPKRCRSAPSESTRQPPRRASSLASTTRLANASTRFVPGARIGLSSAVASGLRGDVIDMGRNLRGTGMERNALPPQLQRLQVDAGNDARRHAWKREQYLRERW